MKRIDESKIERLKKELQIRIDELNQEYERKIKEIEQNCLHEVERTYTNFISYYAFGKDYSEEYLMGVCKHCKESYEIRLVKTHVSTGR